MTLSEFFSSYPDSYAIFGALSEEVQSTGPVEMKAGKSQVAFWRRKAFAWAWAG